MRGSHTCWQSQPYTGHLHRHPLHSRPVYTERCHRQAARPTARQLRATSGEGVQPLLGQELGIGSEHGEGFVQFRVRGKPIHLDVDALNEQLQAAGRTRLRQFMKPDEGLGAILRFENVLADLRTLQHTAWTRVAAEEGLQFPRLESHVYDLPPQRAIVQVLQWTQDQGVAQRLAWRVAECLAQELQQLSKPRQGVQEWLTALARASVPCAVVSTLDRASLTGALERLGLAGFFTARVTAEDGMDTCAQQLLAAAIQLQRAPNRCVAFDASPTGVAAAHNCTMKAVACLGTHPAWKLRQADVTCSHLDELAVYNLRRLFANSGSEFMDYQKAVEVPPRQLRPAPVGVSDFDF